MTRVIVVDDHAVVRAGISRILESEPDLEVVGQTGSGHEAVRLCRELRPDVVLLDFSLPDLDGLEVTRLIVDTCLSVKVLILTMYASEEYAYRLLRAGAAGFLLKGEPAEEMLLALRKVVKRETPAVPSEEVTEELPDDIQELNRRGHLHDLFFDTDKYELKPEARDSLAANAAWLLQHRGVTIVVEGHCDERNTREYNVALNERRASATRDYLVFLGVAADRVKTISYGEERPFAVGHDETAWRLNRRAHFVITGR